MKIQNTLIIYLFCSKCSERMKNQCINQYFEYIEQLLMKALRELSVIKIITFSIPLHLYLIIDWIKYHSEYSQNINLKRAWIFRGSSS